MEGIIYTIVEQIKNISILLNPIIPISTSKILETLNIDKKDRNIENINKNNCFNHSKELKKSEILFNKIENDN